MRSWKELFSNRPRTHRTSPRPSLSLSHLGGSRRKPLLYIYRRRYKISRKTLGVHISCASLAMWAGGGGVERGSSVAEHTWPKAIRGLSRNPESAVKPRAETASDENREKIERWCCCDRCCFSKEARNGPWRRGREQHSSAVCPGPTFPTPAAQRSIQERREKRIQCSILYTCTIVCYIPPLVPPAFAEPRESGGLP